MPCALAFSSRKKPRMEGLALVGAKILKAERMVETARSLLRVLVPFGVLATATTSSLTSTRSGEDGSRVGDSYKAWTLDSSRIGDSCKARTLDGFRIGDLCEAWTLDGF